MARLTATEAARGFSDLLNRVASGEEVEIERGGVPVARVSPPRARTVTAERFRELMATAPSPDADFAGDLRASRAAIGPPDDPWPS